MHYRILIALLWIGLLFTNTQCVAAQDRIDLWYRSSILADPDNTLTPAEALRKKQTFSGTSRFPYSNLGMRQGAVWIYIPLGNLDLSKEWTLTFGYPLLGLAEIYVFNDGTQALQQDVGYSAAVIADSPLTHNLRTPLHLTAGNNELLLRVTTKGSMLVPMSLMSVAQERQGDGFTHLIQGIGAGIIFCLSFYAIAYAMLQRNIMYASYAGAVLFMGLFLLAIRGMGNEHLWGNIPWLAENAAHLFILLCINFSLSFVTRALRLRRYTPELAKAIQCLRYLTIGTVVLVVTDLISFSTAHVLCILSGSISIALVMLVMWNKVHHGARSNWFLFGGWFIYTIGSLGLTLTFLGAINFTNRTFDYFQIATMLEMLSWFVVLGIDTNQKYKASIMLQVERNEMQTLAETDALTGLPNRRGLMTKMSAATSLATPSSYCAVFMMDLDGFKAVNDTHGHKVGDVLLQMVAARLATALRDRDFVSRLGGDEFVVLASRLKNSEDAQVLADKLLTSFNEPFVTECGLSLKVGSTIGFSLSPMDSMDPVKLLELADKALYVGKRAGRGVAVRADVPHVIE
jgi:diguanylate cyclase (GGDEF)-like protein